ncbi:Phage gp6-like head-tail connector protein [Pseudovibrio sp. Ad13]|uniref:head-tail connector protein n=1 Tax=Pseudovibrio sp. Ad13 TaxID=989396 RepID=UPI0007B2581D|nr:head-tail connector protein [Pseudovibrio sp. Ad13]KZK83494.1 Phage gp6-like head-tail connector protein [Pseudovibrio sp. Ad13]
MTAILTVPPALEPVSLAQAHAQLRVSHTHEDDLIERLIKAAREQVETLTRRALIDQEWRLLLDDLSPDRLIRLPVAPVAQVLQVYTYDREGNQQLVPASNYQVDLTGNPARLRFKAGAIGSLRDLNGIEIDFKAGYGAAATAVPAGLQTAILMLVGFWYERRSMLEEDRLTGLMPHGFEAALSPYKVLRI